MQQNLAKILVNGLNLGKPGLKIIRVGNIDFGFWRGMEHVLPEWTQNTEDDQGFTELTLE